MNTTTNTESLSSISTEGARAMTTKTIDLKKTARAAFPEYKGRKIKMVERAAYTMADFWDGGSRSYVKAVELATGRMVEPATFAQNPMNGAAHATIQIPAGIALIDHSIFCGQDCGLTIYTAPRAALPAVALSLAIEAA